jgi:acyl carrier protein
MLTTADIEEKVKEIIAGHFKRLSADALSLDTRLREDVGADSLDLVELVFLFEQELGCSLPDALAIELRTIGDVVRYVETVRG